MKYLKKFNESVFEGEDFLYKEITVTEFRTLQQERSKIVPDEDTMDKIYDLLTDKLDEDIDKSLILDDTGFYQFTILHEDEDVIYVEHLEDDWFLVEYQICEFDNDTYLTTGSYQKDPHFFICDGWEGLVEFIKKEI